MGHWVERGGASLLPGCCVTAAALRVPRARVLSRSPLTGRAARCSLAPCSALALLSLSLPPTPTHLQLLSRSGRDADLAADHQFRGRQQRDPSPGADVDAGPNNARDCKVAVVAPIARCCTASHELLRRAGAHCDSHRRARSAACREHVRAQPRHRRGARPQHRSKRKCRPCRSHAVMRRGKECTCWWLL